MRSSPSKVSETPTWATASRMERKTGSVGKTSVAGIQTRSRTKTTSIAATASVSVCSYTVHVNSDSVAAKSRSRQVKSGHAAVPHTVHSVSTSPAPYVLIPNPEHHVQLSVRGRSPRTANINVNLGGDQASTETKTSSKDKNSRKRAFGVHRPGAVPKSGDSQS